MERKEKNLINIAATVNAPVEKAWQYWTKPEHITKWNFASADWHCPRAENDLSQGGKFSIRMEAKDGSFGFDFEGTYDSVKTNEHISYTMTDGRKVQVDFKKSGKDTDITSVFEAETENSVEMQKDGWQAILNQFKKYAEQQHTEKLRFHIAIKAPAEENKAGLKSRVFTWNPLPICSYYDL